MKLSDATSVSVPTTVQLNEQHVTLYCGATTTLVTLHVCLASRAYVSGAKNGAELAENRLSGNGSVSGVHRKRLSVSGAGSCGAGTERRAGYELSAQRPPRPCQKSTTP